MTFLRADLGFLRAGTRVSIDISGPANVRLMATECAIFRREGFPHLSYGGRYRGGTVSFLVREPDHWVLDVDAEGLATSVWSSQVQIIKPPPPRWRRFRNHAAA